MAGLIDIAAKVMARSEQRLEAVSRNISNASTPGYKSETSFPSLVDAGSSGRSASDLSPVTSTSAAGRADLSQGVLSETGRPLDLAIAGDGFMKVVAGGNEYFTRQGQFERSPDGRVRTPQGFALQGVGGGDVILTSDRPEVLSDGTVLENGRPVARIGLYSTEAPEALISAGGSLFSVPESEAIRVSEAVLHQGMIEGSNVSMAEQMLEMSMAVRQAETGARLVQAYDGLLGQAISTFGQKG